MTSPSFDLLSSSEAARHRVFSGGGKYIPFSSHSQGLELRFLSELPTECYPHRLHLRIDEEPARLDFQYHPEGSFTASVPGGIPDQPEDLRSAVLCCLCEGFLDSLSGRMNQRIRLASGEWELPRGAVELSFRVDRAGESVSGETVPELWGSLALGPLALGSLMSSSVAWPSSEGPLARSTMVDCLVSLASIPMDFRDLKELAIGDCILLGPRETLAPKLHLPGGGAIPCKVPDLLVMNGRISIDDPVLNS